MKRCTKCRILKSFTEFSKDVKRKSRLAPHCKKCASENNKLWYYRQPTEAHRDKMRRWREENPTKALAARLKRHNLTVEQYHDLILGQDGKCAVCECPFGDGGRSINIDHCHITNVVRGLLCKNCNTSLGKFKESPDLLRKAAEYLEKHNKNHT